MMFVKTISLNLPEELIEASSRHSTSLDMTRSEYIRKAIERMNRPVSCKPLEESCRQVLRRGPESER
jgi:predicted DNA-binding protein